MYRTPRFIPDGVAARAARVLDRWSGADAAERRMARQILADYQRQENRRRIGVSDEFRPTAGY